MLNAPFLPPVLMRAQAISRNIIASTNTGQMDSIATWIENSAKDYGKEWAWYQAWLETEFIRKYTQLFKKQPCIS